MSHETVVRLAAGAVLLGVAAVPILAAMERWDDRQRANRRATPRLCVHRCGRRVVPPHVECEECHDARQW